MEDNGKLEQNAENEIEKITEKKDEKRDEKSRKVNSKEKTLGQSFDEWRKGCVGEFRKIVWPSRDELIKKTFTVIVVSLIIGAVIVAMDAAFSTGLTGIVSLMSK